MPFPLHCEQPLRQTKRETDFLLLSKFPIAHTGGVALLRYSTVLCYWLEQLLCMAVNTKSPIYPAPFPQCADSGDVR